MTNATLPHVLPLALIFSLVATFCTEELAAQWDQLLTPVSEPVKGPVA